MNVIYFCVSYEILSECRFKEVIFNSKKTFLQIKLNIVNVGEFGFNGSFCA